MAYPHNTDDDPVQGDQLRSLIHRIERLEEESKAINDDKAEVYSEAKANGYDTKIMKKVVALRRRDPNERKEEEAILDLYLQAVGENKDSDSPVRRAQQPTAAPVSRAPAREEAPSLPGNEELAYQEIKAMVLRERTASTAGLQRRYQIGFNKASGFMERLEAEGIVSKPNSAGKRDILVTNFGDAAADMAATLKAANATMEVRAAPGSVFAAAGKAVQAAGGPVTVTETPAPAGDAEDPFGA